MNTIQNTIINKYLHLTHYRIHNTVSLYTLHNTQYNNTLQFPFDRIQNTEYRLQMTEHRIHNTQYTIQNTPDRIYIPFTEYRNQ